MLNIGSPYKLMSTDSPELILYFREGCHLCEDMEQQLHELLDKDAYRLRRVDIDEVPALRTRYNSLVPVLSLDGRQLCEHFLDLKTVTEALTSYNSESLANARASIGLQSQCDSPVALSTGKPPTA